ncbi:hypothetical protein P7K49_009658 [Saguinus oedipus]|uniref:Uncharacterized protein n=1 Tax=Saguinus oedipus TaxID=9490 RepID=A0ABQ9VNS4_SAGOE|nr:hypothetical protein P7K49_009658 [Saguinus oedipus]
MGGKASLQRGRGKSSPASQAPAKSSFCSIRSRRNPESPWPPEAVAGVFSEKRGRPPRLLWPAGRGAGQRRQPVPRHPRQLMDADCSGGGGGSACAGGWARCPQPRAWRPTRGQPPLRPRSPTQGRPLLAPASQLAAAQPLPPPPLCPSPLPPPSLSGSQATSSGSLTHRQFPDHCKTVPQEAPRVPRLPPPWSQTAPGLLALAKSSWGAQQREREGEERRRGTDP